MYLEGLAADCMKTDGKIFKSLGQAIVHFNGGALPFYEEFIFEEGEAPCGTMEVEGEDDALNEKAAQEDDDRKASRLGGVKENMCKSGMLFADLRHGVHIGKFDADFKAMCYVDRGSEPSLTVQAVIEASDKSEDKSQGYEFLKFNRELVRLINLAQNRSVAPVAAGGSAPALSVRALARQRSNPDEDGARMQEERDSTWRSVIQQRKKFVTLSAPKDGATLDAALPAAFRQCGAVHKFTGTINESHRVFVASAELYHEFKEEPWTQSSPPPADAWTTICKFVSSQNGPVDFGLVSDGRDRSTRRVQEDAFGAKGDSVTAVNEIWVLYKGGGRLGKLVGHACKTVLSSNHVEAALLRVPVARNKLKINKRECYSACGEATTAYNSYTAVEYRSRSELPRISTTEKNKIFVNAGRKAVPEDWAEEYGANEPLFWEEFKPLSLWRALLQDYKIKAVFDVTAGSGCLAEACMLEGIVYHGVRAAPRSDGLLVCLI